MIGKDRHFIIPIVHAYYLQDIRVKDIRAIAMRAYSLLLSQMHE